MTGEAKDAGHQANGKKRELVPVYTTDAERRDMLDSSSHLRHWNYRGTRCDACGTPNSEVAGLLIQCGKCKDAYYCSTKCFNSDLKRHGAFCLTSRLNRQPKSGPELYRDRRPGEDEGVGESEERPPSATPRALLTSPEETVITPSSGWQPAAYAKRRDASVVSDDVSDSDNTESDDSSVSSVASSATGTSAASRSTHRSGDEEGGANANDAGNGGIPAAVEERGDQVATASRTAAEVAVSESEPSPVPKPTPETERSPVRAVDFDGDAEEEEETHRRRGRFPLEPEEEESTRHLRVGDGIVPEHHWEPETVTLEEAETIRRQYGWDVPDWVLKSPLRRSALGGRLADEGVDLVREKGRRAAVEPQQPEWVVRSPLRRRSQPPQAAAPTATASSGRSTAAAVARKPSTDMSPKRVDSQARTTFRNDNPDPASDWNLLFPTTAGRTTALCKNRQPRLPEWALNSPPKISSSKFHGRAASDEACDPASFGSPRGSSASSNAGPLPTSMAPVQPHAPDSKQTRASTSLRSQTEGSMESEPPCSNPLSSLVSRQGKPPPAAIEEASTAALPGIGLARKLVAPHRNAPHPVPQPPEWVVQSPLRRVIVPKKAATTTTFERGPEEENAAASDDGAAASYTQQLRSNLRRLPGDVASPQSEPTPPTIG